MSGFVAGWIQDTFSNLASTGLKAVGGYAGNAICGIGDVVERSGQTVGNGLTKKYNVVGKKLSDVGGPSKPASRTQVTESQKIVQASSRSTILAPGPIPNPSKPLRAGRPKIVDGSIQVSKMSAEKLVASKPVSSVKSGKTRSIAGKTNAGAMQQHGPKVVHSKRSLPHTAARGKARASYVQKDSGSAVVR